MSKGTILELIMAGVAMIASFVFGNISAGLAWLVVGVLVLKHEGDKY